MNIYQATLRSGPEVTRTVAVQAHDEEDARYLIDRLLASNREQILDDKIRDITDTRWEKETFRDFVEREDDIDALLVTGGRNPSVVESGWDRKRVPV